MPPFFWPAGLTTPITPPEGKKRCRGMMPPRERGRPARTILDTALANFATWFDRQRRFPGGTGVVKRLGRIRMRADALLLRNENACNVH